MSGIEDSPRTPRRRFLRREFRHDRRRLLDVIVLNGGPALCILLTLNAGVGLAFLVGVVLLAYGAIFYFFPEPVSIRPSLHDQHDEGAPVFPVETPWLDLALVLLVPLSVMAWLLYLVWTHTVLGKLGLGLATFGLPAAVVLVSWFVLKHQEHHVKVTRIPSPRALVGGLIGLWVAAVFVFVVCVVSWIYRFALR